MIATILAALTPFLIAILKFIYEITNTPKPITYYGPNERRRDDIASVVDRMRGGGQSPQRADAAAGTDNGKSGT